MHLHVLRVQPRASNLMQRPQSSHYLYHISHAFINKFLRNWGVNLECVSSYH